MYMSRSDSSIRFEKENGVGIRVSQDMYNRYKTTIAEVEKLQFNVLYEGYEKEVAITVFNEFFEHYTLSEVENVNDVQWNSKD